MAVPEENFQIVVPLQLRCMSLSLVFCNRRVHTFFSRLSLSEGMLSSFFFLNLNTFFFYLFFWQNSNLHLHFLHIPTLQGRERVLKATELCSCFGYNPAGCRLTLILNGLLRLQMPECIVVVSSQSSESGPVTLCAQAWSLNSAFPL